MIIIKDDDDDEILNIYSKLDQFKREVFKKVKVIVNIYKTQ